MKVVVGITGASGISYAVDLLERLNKKGIEIYLVMSEWSERLVEEETDYKIEDIKKYAKECFDNKNMAASIASSSFVVDSMIVIRSFVTIENLAFSEKIKLFSSTFLISKEGTASVSPKIVSGKI